MGIIGCGIMFTGLLLGALSGSLFISIIIVSIGAVITSTVLIYERMQEQNTHIYTNTVYEALTHKPVYTYRHTYTYTQACAQRAQAWKKQRSLSHE
jgi:hypothetical protein